MFAKCLGDGKEEGCSRRQCGGTGTSGLHMGVWLHRGDGFGRDGEFIGISNGSFVDEVNNRGQGPKGLGMGRAGWEVGGV